MTRNPRSVRRWAGIKLVAGGAMLFQTLPLGSCNFGDITTTTTTTLDGRQVLVDLILGVVLPPIEAAVTNAVNGLIGDGDEE